MVKVLREEQDVLFLGAQADERPAVPCACGRGRWNGDGWSQGRDVRAVPLGLLTVHVRLTCRRYRCSACRGSAPQPSAQMDGMLLPALRDLVVQEALHHPVAQVARRYELDPSVVKRVVDAELTRRMKARPRPAMRHLGLDAVRFDGEPRLALVDGDTGRYEAFHIDERPATVRRALRELGAPPEIITMDLSYTLRSAAREVYPDAILVADKYHVVQAVNAAIDRYRQAHGPAGTQLLRKTGARSHQLAARLQCEGYGDVVAAWHWRNALKGIWSASEPVEARAALLAWLDACPPGLRSTVAGLLTTLRDWQHEISRHALGTNASTEAANRRAREWSLVSSNMEWRRVARRLILASSGSELDAKHKARLAVLAAVGARQQRTPTNSRSASSPPAQRTAWTRAQRRKREREKGDVVRSVSGGQ